MSDLNTTELKTVLDVTESLKNQGEENEELTIEDLGELSGGSLTLNHNATCTFVD